MDDEHTIKDKINISTSKIELDDALLNRMIKLADLGAFSFKAMNLTITEPQRKSKIVPGMDLVVRCVTNQDMEEMFDVGMTYFARFTDKDLPRLIYVENKLGQYVFVPPVCFQIIDTVDMKDENGNPQECSLGHNVNLNMPAKSCEDCCYHDMLSGGKYHVCRAINREKDFDKEDVPNYSPEDLFRTFENIKIFFK